MHQNNTQQNNTWLCTKEVLIFLYHRFGEIVEGLPQAVAIEVWKLLLKAIKEYLPKLGHEGG